MLPEIQDNCPGKSVGIGSEPVVANALSRCLAHPAERRAPQECVYYIVWPTVQLSLRAECFCSAEFHGLIWFVFFVYFLDLLFVVNSILLL